MPMLQRQGDILLKRVNTIPTDVKKKDNIIALGEVTGHHHRFDVQAPVQVFVQPSTNTQFIDVSSQAVLMHEEHKNQVVEPGIYQVITQREKNLLNEIRKVSD